MKEEFLAYKLANMSLSEKIGQMIMIDYRNVHEMTSELENILTTYNPGGFILFKGNVPTHDEKQKNYIQTQKFLSDIKNATDIKGMIAVDQEGGRVQRLDERVGFDNYPPMSEIGATKNPQLAFDLGVTMGRELKKIGVDMDMAPILDIFSNPKNTAIGDRAFGTTSDVVKQMAFSYADGLKKENIIPVGKHFPGHGGTLKDSHIDLPFIDKTKEELKALELLPFIEAVHQKLPGLMIGHIAVPKIDENNIPASISKVMISDLLNQELGYEGLIMPDSLKMKALTKYFTNEDVYLRCVNAGNDFILMPQDIKEAYEVIYRKVNEGEISEERIDSSVYKILSTKFDYGFFDEEYKVFLSSFNHGGGRRR